MTALEIDLQELAARAVSVEAAQVRMPIMITPLEAGTLLRACQAFRAAGEFVSRYNELSRSADETVRKLTGAWSNGHDRRS